MKIVHLTDTYGPVVGGIERQIERLAGLQVQAGHEVTVVSGRFGAAPAERVEHGVLVRRPTRPRSPGRALPMRADDMDADVFHAHVSVLSPGTLRAAALVHDVRLPLAVTAHSMWPVDSRWCRTVVHLAGLDTPQVAWSSVSTAAAERVARTLSPDSTVHIVPNTVDVSWWQSGARVGHREEVTALLVGRLARRKGVLPLVRALAQDWPDRLQVVVVGDGPQREAIDRLVRRHGLGDRVEVLGLRSPVGIRRLLHERTDLFVAPSALESFGIAALEARAAGIPVLARRGTGVADFVRDGVDGWLADSAAELAQGLVALTAARAQLSALQTSARHHPPPVDQAGSLAAVDRLYVRAREKVRSGADTHLRRGSALLTASASPS